MEVWDLLRPSLRRLTVLGVVALVAALAAVLVEHARAAQYDGRVSVYFAQALGLDTTSNSVDPTADQLTSVLKLPSVEAKAAAAGGVPLHVVRDASVSHTAGSPIIDITAHGSRDQATKAAPALAAAGLDYFAQQGVARAQSVQASATADLATINGELADFTARAGVPDVDAAAATAAAAVAAATPGTAEAKLAAANLAKYRALQPQFDLLTTEVAGARASVSAAYSAVGAAQGVAKAVQLPGNVVTAPITPASRITAYLRAAVGSAVVVVVVGVAYLALVELRRQRAGGTAPGAGVAATTARHAAPGRRSAPASPPPTSQPPTSQPPTSPPLAARAPAAPVTAPAVAPEPSTSDPYAGQAARFMRDQQRLAEAAREAEEQELQRRILRDAFQVVEREERGVPADVPRPTVDAADRLGLGRPEQTTPAPEPEVTPYLAEQNVPGDVVPDAAPQAAPDAEPESATERATEPVVEPDEEPDGGPIAPVHPLFGERPRGQIRVLRVVPDPVEDDQDGRANAGS